MARRNAQGESVETGRWLLTYSDIMNNLLVLFVVMYAMSLIDLQKFKTLADQFNSTLGGGGAYTASQGTGVIPGDGSESSTNSSSKDRFDELYETVKKDLKEKGYEDQIVIEKEENSIHLRFKDSVLFFPDSPVMKDEGNDILKYVGTTIKQIDPLVRLIEIGGHTAKVGEDTTNDFYSWELSSDRALTVLKFFVQRCELPQSKMTVSGYSHYFSVSDNSTEEGRSQNRRVEIRISKAEGA